MLKISPDDVGLPLKSGPYQEARTVLLSPFISCAGDWGLYTGVAYSVSDETTTLPEHEAIKRQQNKRQKRGIGESEEHQKNICFILQFTDSPFPFYRMYLLRSSSLTTSDSLSST